MGISFFGYWMHFSEKDNRVLLPIIAKLSKKYDKGEVFPPHISIHAPVLISFNKAKELADASVKGFSKFEVEVGSFGYSDEWKKTLFIQLKEDRHLNKIGTNIRKVLSKSSKSHKIDPHVSLLYKEGIKADEKKKIIKELKIPRRFTVSSMAVVTAEMGIKSRRDYSKWKVVYEKELK